MSSVQKLPETGSILHGTRVNLCLLSLRHFTFILVIVLGHGLSAAAQEPEAPADRIDALPQPIQDFRYVAAHRVPLDPGRMTWSWAIGQFTLRGPVEETLRPAHLAQPIAGRVGDASYFDSSVGRVDPTTGRVTRLGDETIGRLPDAAKRGVIAFDSRRGRLLAYHNGYLYAYDVDAHRWTSRKRANLGEIAALVYAPDADVLYAIGRLAALRGRPRRGGLALFKIDVDGEVVDTAKFDDNVTARLPAMNFRGRSGDMDLAYHRGHLYLHAGDQRLIIRLPDCTVVYHGVADPAAQSHPLADSGERDGGARSASPSKRLRQAVEHLKKKIALTTTPGNEDRAARVLDRFARIEAESESGDYPHDSVAELHAVGIYEPPDGVPDQRVDVEVTLRARPVTLLLTAYDATRWRVSVAEGASLAGVVLAGYHAHESEGVGDDVPVIDLTQDAIARDLFLCHDARESAGLREAVRLFLGGNLMSVQGSYNDRQTFVVGPDSADWRAEYALARLRALENQWLLDEVQGVEFLGLDRTLQQGRPNSVLSTFTLAGPVPGSGVALAEPLVQVVGEPAEGRVWGISDSDVFRVDPDTGATEALTADLPDLGRLTAIALDQHEHCLFVAGTQERRTTNGVSISGHKWLKFDLPTNNWQTLAYPSTDVGGIAYLPATRTLYGLDLPYHRRQVFSLATLNRHAARLSVAWTTERFQWHPWDGAPQLIPVKEFLVAIVPPRSWLPPNLRQRSDIYVINPDDGHMAYAGSFGE